MTLHYPSSYLGPPSHDYTDLTSAPTSQTTEQKKAANLVSSPAQESPEESRTELNLPLGTTIDALCKGVPRTGEDYAEHVYKVASTLYKDGRDLTAEQESQLLAKFDALAALYADFSSSQHPSSSKLYLTVERCFDLFIRIATGAEKLPFATSVMRYLTTVLMALNYWELYNLLNWKPAIYQFLDLIGLDLHEYYSRFVRDMKSFEYEEPEVPYSDMRLAARTKWNRRQAMELKMAQAASYSPDFDDGEKDSDSLERLEENDNFVAVKGQEKQRNTPRERRKVRVDLKLAAHRIIKKATIKEGSKLLNYDPDVVHECRLASPDEPDKLCLRRFSRKYELIRHQETVHSKKKKLFKCFVCVKQDPKNGPRIFTRHDTLAKHIRVNHRISGKEAKAEVAYSKKHAEIVEEGDITVHVGRRKTKVDFELRAQMEQKGLARELEQGAMLDVVDESPNFGSVSGDDEADNALDQDNYNDRDHEQEPTPEGD